MNRSRPAAFLCLIALAAAMPLMPVSGAALAGKQLLALVLALLGGLLSWRDALRGRTAPRLGTPTDVAFGVWMLAALPGLAVAANPGMTRYQLGLALVLALTWVLAVKTVRTPGDVRRLLVAVLYAGGVMAVLGLVGYSRFLADGAPESARSAYLSTALFAHSYLAAQYLVMVLAGGVVFLVERGGSPRWRLAIGLMLLPIAADLLVIGSRGAYLALAVALGTSALLRARARPGGGRVRRLLLAGVATFAAWALLAVVLLAVPALTGTLQEATHHALDRWLMLFRPEQSGLNFNRLEIWQSTLRLFADHPLLGVGLGGFDTALAPYHASARLVPHAHDQLLQVLADTGLVGLVAFGLLLRHAVRAARRGARFLVDDPERRAPFHAAVAALVAALVSFVFETPLHWIESGTLIVMLLAVVTRAGCLARDGPTRRATAHGALLATVAVLAVAAPSWAGWLPATLDAAAAQRDHARALEAQTGGDALEAAHLWEQAVGHLAEADASFPHKADFAALAADILFLHLRRPEEALRWALLAERRVPGSFVHANVTAKILMTLGRPEAALPHLRAALRADPGYGSIATYLTIARAYAQTRRDEQAWFILTDLVESAHYYTVQPHVLLDTVRLDVRLDRDLGRAEAMLDLFARLVDDPEAIDAYRQLREQVTAMRDRPLRPTGG